MGTVSRPIKTAGTTTYVAEKAILGATAYIRAAEVDADLTTLYTLVNGNLDDDNLADGISGTKLADLSIPFTKLGDASIPTTKLVVGASTANRVTAQPVSGQNANTVEQTVLTLPSLTTRGGRVLVIGHWGAYLGLGLLSVASQNTGTLTLRIKRAGSTIYTVEQYIEAPGPHTALTNYMRVPIPFPQFMDVPAAGSHVYTITAQTTASYCQFQLPVSNQGQAWAEEAA